LFLQCNGKITFGGVENEKIIGEVKRKSQYSNRERNAGERNCKYTERIRMVFKVLKEGRI
jgi:hypothetical protein